MGELLKYVSLEQYQKEVKDLKSGETRVIYSDTERKIKLKKQGRKVFNVIVNYGNIPIADIAKNLLVQA